MSAVSFARDVAVVVSKTNPLKIISLADLTKMAKPTGKAQGGKPVVFVMKDPAGADMKLVLQKVFAMTADEVRAMVVSNKQSFVIVDSDAAVLNTVSSVPNAIGVLDVYSINGAVTVLKVDGKLPLEPGYALHGQ
jgi:hypothetical protein